MRVVSKLHLFEMVKCDGEDFYVYEPHTNEVSEEHFNFLSAIKELIPGKEFVSRLIYMKSLDKGEVVILLEIDKNDVTTELEQSKEILGFKLESNEMMDDDETMVFMFSKEIVQ